MTTGGGAGLVLAVDGGNFKTYLALLDAGGGLRSLVRGAGSSPHELGMAGSVALLESLLERACADAGLPAGRPLAAAAHILLAGVDSPEEQAELRGAIERLAWAEQLVVDNDMPALLRAGTDRGWGIAVVCGAGINCLGRAADGHEARFLSLGAISGDWGGGPDVGLAALGAAVRGADGRGPRTVLESSVTAHFGMNDPIEVARAFHREQLPTARLGELASVVLAHCGDDPAATEIVRRLADEVSAFARAALARLELADAEPDVVLGGRLLRAVPATVIETIERSITEVAPGARVFVSPSEPIVGAALLGLDLLGADGSAHDRARAELDAAAGALARSA